MMTKNTLFDLGITLKDDEASVFDVYSKKSKRKYQNRFSDNMEDFYVPRIEAEALAEMKAFYINNRIGSDFSIEDMRKLKIVLSIDEFCKRNKVKLSVDKTPMRNKLESSYVGFLSTNNNRIMCRNINSNLSKEDFRWYNVILNENNLNQYTFYSIPSSIDLYYTHDINVQEVKIKWLIKVIIV